MSKESPFRKRKKLKQHRIIREAAPYRRVWLPLIQRYIIGEIVPTLVLGLLLFSFVLLVQMLLSQFRVVMEAGVSGATLGKMLLCLLPAVLVNTASFALLLSILVVYGRMSEDNELVATTAGGISYRHLLQPPLVIGVGLMILLYAGANSIGPRAVQVQHRLLQAGLEEVVRGSLHEGFNGLGPLDIYVRSREAGELRDVAILQRAEVPQPVGPPEELTTMALAPRGMMVFDAESYQSRLWMEDGSLSFPVGGDGFLDLSFSRLEMGMDVGTGLEKAVKRLGVERACSSGELRQRLKKLRAMDGMNEDEEEQLFRIESILAERVATPASAVVFALLGAPLGLWVGFGKRVFAFLGALVICFAFFILQSGCENLAREGVLPATLALWAPNLLFAVIAVALNTWVARH